jgi:fengycin family lipopeptide synthetase D/gramicidin S synthase 2/tyrocidine synthetase-3
MDQQVKIRGFRIELGEIESRLLTYEPVKEAVVIDRKDQSGDKYLCAYIVTLDVDPDAKGMAFEKMPKPVSTELKEYLSRTLPDYMIPPHFVLMDHIPLTNSGKVDRNALPEPKIESYVEYAAPRSDTEKKLTEIWAEVLEIDKNDISIDANFFDLGGHSLKATIMVSKIKKILNAAISLVNVFETLTIREMAKYILPGDKDRFLPVEPAEEREFYALTPMQNQFFILNQLQTIKTAYNLPSVLTVEGKLDRKRLKHAFLKLIHRHAALRTSFIVAGGQPVQRIHRDVDFDLEYDTPAESQSEVEFIKRFIRPFDLSRAPLLRVGLLEIEEEKHVLMFDMHHIISDGTSLGILVRDIVTFYEGKEPPPLPLQYRDFAQWLYSPEGQDAIAAQEAYWLGLFKGPLPVLNMYTDYPRPPVQSFAGDTILFSIGNELTPKIRRLMAETGTTLFMVLLAALNVLLSGYSGQEDIVVGAPIAGRVNADFENIIALFINALPIRNYPRKDKVFRQFLSEVKENTIKAYENQGYPFETLLEKLNVEKDLGRNPLFDVELVILNMEIPTLETKGLTFSPYEHKLDVTQVDIDIYVLEYEEEIRVNLMYCTELFKKETMEGFIAFFKEILSTAADNKEVKLEDIEMSHHLAAAQSRLIQDDTDAFGF